jgi:hypothetical protein
MIDLLARLTLSEGPTYLALPLALDGDALTLAVPRSRAPILAPDHVIDVTLEAGGGAFRARAAVASVDRAEDALDVRVVWLNPDRVRLRMPVRVRRALERETVNRGQPAIVKAKLGENAWQGIVRDLSPDDVTLEIDTFWAPTPGDSVPIRVAIPDGRAAIELPAQVTEVADLGDGRARITLLWAGRSRLADRVSDRINAFLLTRRSRRTAATG